MVHVIQVIKRADCLTKERTKYVGSVYLLFIKDNKILLLKRCNTGFEDGNYGLVAGHMEGNESVTQAAIREAKEETGVSLKPEDLQVVHVMHRKCEKDERIDFFLKATKWSKEPVNAEPNKCSDLTYFPVNELPSNIIPYIKKAIEHSLKGEFYSEFGYK